MSGAEGEANTTAQVAELSGAQRAMQEAEKKKEMEALIRKRGGKKQVNPEDPHAFWDTMPVPKLSAPDLEADPDGDVGPMEEKTLDQVRQEPYDLPSVDFEWCSMDVTDDAQLAEIYTLLFENYVEDDDNMFRFDYSTNFLRWALMPPGYLPEWHVGVRMTTKKKKSKLVGFITGVPANVQTGESIMPMCEINFLCCWKKLRGKRLAPLLIKEVTRRVNLTGIWQACYTAGVVLPKPITVCRYYHRSLNPKKLIDVDFSRLAPRMTMKMTKKLYEVDKQTRLPGIRPMTEEDVPSACELLNKYLSKFQLHPVFDHDEFRHWLFPREGVIQSFVICNAEGVVTDFLSFYALPSTIMNHPNYTSLNAAYSYYNVATTVEWDALMMDGLILAKQRDFDVFNALDLMDNKEFIEKLKFKPGDGNLQYYLFNWRTKEITPQETALVLL